MGHGNTMLSATQGKAIAAPALDRTRLKVFVVIQGIETDIVDQAPSSTAAPSAK